MFTGEEGCARRLLSDTLGERREAARFLGGDEGAELLGAGRSSWPRRLGVGLKDPQ